MRDLAPKRVTYPTNGATPTEEADIKRNRDLDAQNRWGERFYYFNSHRTGGDYAWHADNLHTAEGSPKPEQVTARWTFAGTWDPENPAGPVIRSIMWGGGTARVVFSENVTVKGRPAFALRSGEVVAIYQSGSGSDTLVFAGTFKATSEAPRLQLAGGAIVATEAHATLRTANLALPPL
jgi:pectinesterase